MGLDWTDEPRVKRLEVMRDRVADLKAWAKSRIDHADRQSVDHFDAISRERASQEAQTLRAVLNILDGKETP